MSLPDVSHEEPATGSGWNFADIFERIAQLVPDRPAIIDAGRVTSWRDFDVRSAALAHALVAECSLERQAKVAVYLENCAEFLESYNGILKAGLVPVNVNYRYGPDELVYLLGDADAEAVIVGARFLPQVRAISHRLPRIRVWIVVGDNVADGSGGPACLSYDDLIAAHAGLELDRRRSGDDLILVYTGGTTGLPKGVMWRQTDMFDALIGASRTAFNLPAVDTVEELVAGVPEVPGPRGLAASPFMHGTGLMHQLVMLHAGGTCVVFRGGGFDAERLLQTMADHAVTAAVLVGDAFARPVLDVLERAPGRYDLSRLEVISSSGAIWSPAVKAGILRHLPHVSLFDSLASSEGFGLASAVTTVDNVDRPVRFTAGPYVRVRSDEGTWITPETGGGIGRLVVTGPLPLGYYKDPVKSAQTFQVIDGQRYSMPGDYVEMFSDATIRFLGRGSACINTGGEKVYAEEVEAVVRSHPAVKDAAVVGAPDDRFGSIVCAVVALRDGATLTTDALAAHVEASLARFKVPRRLIVVAEVPRAANGKLDYRALASIVEAEAEASSRGRPGL